MLCHPAGRSLSDGLWHSVSVKLNGHQASVAMDNDTPSSMMLGHHTQPGNTVMIGGDGTYDGTHLRFMQTCNKHAMILNNKKKKTQ